MSDDRFDQRMAARVDQVLSDPDLDRIGELDAAALRRLRQACEFEEHRVSYARRILQGRIDVLRAEASGREGGEARGALERLPAVLADGGQQQAFDPATARPPARLEPDELGEDVQVEGPVDVGRLDDAELEELAARYADQEATLSGLRRRLFDTIDRLQAEIADRYRQGTTSVSELLAGD